MLNARQGSKVKDAQIKNFGRLHASAQTFSCVLLGGRKKSSHSIVILPLGLCTEYVTRSGGLEFVQITVSLIRLYFVGSERFGYTILFNLMETRGGYGWFRKAQQECEYCVHSPRFSDFNIVYKPVLVSLQLFFRAERVGKYRHP